MRFLQTQLTLQYLYPFFLVVQILLKKSLILNVFTLTHLLNLRQFVLHFLQLLLVKLLSMVSVLHAFFKVSVLILIQRWKLPCIHLVLVALKILNWAKVIVGNLFKNMFLYQNFSVRFLLLGSDIKFLQTTIWLYQNSILVHIPLISKVIEH